MQSTTKAEVLQQYAEVGARVRLKDLDQERRTILQMFPRLNGAGTNSTAGNTGAGGNGAGVLHAPTVTRGAAQTRPAKRPMSQRQREAIRRRMKAFWKTKKAASTASK